MPQISKKIRDAILTQLSDVTKGFNPNLAAVASTYGITPFEIDWAGKTNWLFGRIDPNSIESSDTLAYPVLTIDTLGSVDTGDVVTATFAGQVLAIIEIHYSWAQEQLIPDFASVGDAIEDAMFTTFNGPANQPYFSSGIRYSGHLEFSKGPIQMGSGQNWRQTLQFRPRMRLVA